jgi:glycosyltransferase involved in cell wall biosynthesis
MKELYNREDQNKRGAYRQPWLKATRKPAVTVVLPAFNEAEVVGKTVKRIRKLHPDFEILVVDDGSTDSTMQAAMDAGANVWPHPYNMGNGAAVKSGLRAARGDYVVLMDADGQHDPADIARLLEKADRFDMVSRGPHQSLENQSPPQPRQRHL